MGGMLGGVEWIMGRSWGDHQNHGFRTRKNQLWLFIVGEERTYTCGFDQHDWG